MPSWKKVIISGSDAALNSLTVTNIITGSLAGTASYAITSTNAISSSRAISASYATVAQTLLGTVTSASYATVASSSLFATNASSSLFATSASHADLLDGLHATSFVLNSQTSSMTVLSASFAINASSSLFATSASHADLLDGLHATSFVLNSQTSSMTVNSASFAINASSSLWAVSASRAATASYAQNLQISGSINNVDYIDFNTGSAVPAYKSGRVYWDETSGALSVYNAEADIALQVGQENWVRVWNATGVLVANGASVRLVGSHGDTPQIVLAQSVQVSGSITRDNQILGLATHDIEINSFGYITTQGLVKGLNTSAFADGDRLYVSSSAGKLTKIPPLAPYEIIPAGIVVKAGPGGSGIIYSDPYQPMDFADLSSTEIGDYTYGDLWTYNQSGSVGVWKHTNQLSGSYSVTGSWSATSFTGSLLGTASFVNGNIFTNSNSATSASYATVASSSLFATSASYAVSSSRAVSSSFASTTPFADISANAETAQTTNIIDTTTGTGPFYITFVDGTSGGRSQRVDSSTLTYNASTDTITVDKLTGTASYAISASQALNATSATSATSASYATIASSSLFATNASSSLRAVSSSFATLAATATVAGKTNIGNTGGGGNYYMMMTDAIVGANGTSFDTSNLTNPIYYDASTETLYSKNFNGNHQGNLTGTASYATSASRALTASSAPLYLPLTGGTISGNLTVVGTASFAYTTASIVNVGAATINLNTNNPSVRFGGINVIDSGSFGTSSTGSLLWDSLNNKWIYSNPSGSTYSGGMLISGPRNTGSIGDEIGTLNNYITKGQGGDHITSSMIYEDNAGLVGIGTTSPNGKLEILNSGLGIILDKYTGGTYGAIYVGGITPSGTNPILLGSSTKTFLNTESGGSIALSIGTSEKLNITSAGNVGIGTTSPNAKLDVNGNTIITGSLIQGVTGNIAGTQAHAEGYLTQANGSYSHAEGNTTIALGASSHAEGVGTTARTDYSHAEGEGTYASGSVSHAEGYYATASGNYSHAEGSFTVASGNYSHAEGISTRATGPGTHAEGYNTLASGDRAHAEGYFSTASGQYSHAAGNQSVADGAYQSVVGQLNISSSDVAAFIIGNGNALTQVRSNLLFASASQVQITGSLIVTNGITGSFSGTTTSASFAINASSSLWAVSSSRSISASYATVASSSLFATNASSSLRAVSASFASTASQTNAIVTGTNSADLVYGQMADNDYFRIRIGGTITNSGFAEIATSDEGTEPIYFRQYSAGFTIITRTATLLDGSGNTQFPGSVSASSFLGPLTGSLLGTASYATSASIASSSLRSVSASYATFANSASNASAVNITNTSVNATFYPTFVNGTGGTNNGLQVDSSTLTYNPSTNTLTVDNLTGTSSYAISSSKAISSSYADVAKNAVFIDNQSFNQNYYPIFSQGAGSNNLQIDTSIFTYNPSTNLLNTTSSYATSASQAISSSFATSASFLNSTTNGFIQNGNSFGTTATLGTNDNQSLALETNGTTRMFISSSGNVGIGTTTPSASLHVYGTSPNILLEQNPGSSGNVSLSLQPAGGSNTASIRMVNKYVYVNTSADQSLRIGNDLVTPQATITTAGAMGLGIVPTNTAGRFEASNDIVAYSTSDKRWKNNIVKIDSPLEKISQINGVEFDWIEDEPFHGNKGHDVGVIAQEIEKVLPEAVQTRESGMKAVQYDKIIPLLIESIKEQQKQIDELKQIINGYTR